MDCFEGGVHLKIETLKLLLLIIWQQGYFALQLQMDGLKETVGWTSMDYPDIRAKPWTDQCGKHVPPFGYICDPSPEAIITKEEAYLLNEMLIDLAKSTQCRCKRRSQCMTKFQDDTKKQVQIGFIVAIAFVHKMLSQGFKSVQVAADKFSKSVRTRWGLGDCGNMMLILIWEEHQMIHISTDEDLTSLYLTASEKERIVTNVRDKIRNKEYVLAIEQILAEVKRELDGDPEKPVDIGILALTVSSGIALFVVGIITMCVCAFRCCGNLRNAPLKEVIERVENLRAEFNNRNNNVNNYALNNNDSNSLLSNANLLYAGGGDTTAIGNNAGSNYPSSVDIIQEESPSIYLDGKHSLV